MPFTGTPGAFEVGSPASRSTVAKAPLGSKAYDEKGNEFIYVKAGAAIDANEAVMFSGSALGFDDVRKTSGLHKPVLGVATAAFASGAFGYIQSKGVVTCKVIVSTAAGSSLVASGTAGTLKIGEATDLAYRPAVALVTGVAEGSAVALL
jgi:hypothetical protein